mmetsp:Transcript_13927/g.35440  ORF Transcript_13927/g.35440 Transcript_13927/m.35440 type:complete len:307 (-) Transcript_13927:1266-2186(-)
MHVFIDSPPTCNPKAPADTTRRACLRAAQPREPKIARGTAINWDLGGLQEPQTAFPKRLPVLTLFHCGSDSRMLVSPQLLTARGGVGVPRAGTPAVREATPAGCGSPATGALFCRFGGGAGAVAEAALPSEIFCNSRSATRARWSDGHHKLGNPCSDSRAGGGSKAATRRLREQKMWSRHSMKRVSPVVGLLKLLASPFLGLKRRRMNAASPVATSQAFCRPRPSGSANCGAKNGPSGGGRSGGGPAHAHSGHDDALFCFSRPQPHRWSQQSGESPSSVAFGHCSRLMKALHVVPRAQERFPMLRP